MKMKKNKVEYCSMAALRYAKVIHELKIPEEDILDTGRIFQAEPELLRILESPVVTKEKKEILIDRIFPENMRKFLKVLTSYGKIGATQEIVKAYQDQKNRMSGIAAAVLLYAVPPSSEQLDRMETFIKKKYHVNGVQWEMQEDKSLIGGFILNVDGKEYDYSIEGRLKRLEQKLTRR